MATFAKQLARKEMRRAGVFKVSLRQRKAMKAAQEVIEEKERAAAILKAYEPAPETPQTFGRRTANAVSRFFQRRRA